MGSTDTAQCQASSVSLLGSVGGDPGPGGPQGSDVRKRGSPATLCLDVCETTWRIWILSGVNCYGNTVNVMVPSGDYVNTRERRL